MGAKWDTAVEARANGSHCNFQLPSIPSIPLPAPPAIPLPTFPPPLPTINLYCPFDEAEEEMPQ
jgi:hypothetical protein